jgi:hypothetical protein
LLDRRRTSIGIIELRTHLTNSDALPDNQSREAVDIVSVAELGFELGFRNPLVPPVRLHKKSLAHFKTEQDESYIYSYIYSNARPARHFEFGTWEGHGVVLCASACDAEIWTVNLPDGEADELGKPRYPRMATSSADPTMIATDSGSAIGWKYRKAGYANRVHQLLCDSRSIDTKALPEGTFDTILVDGGHSRDVVASDTDKAILLLASGGILMWHDFCPDPETLRLMESPRGVVQAFAQNLARWRPYFKKLFWIRPSWILIGVKG